MTIRETYEFLTNKFPDLNIDSYNVVESVQKHRYYWKPKKVKTLLLAESHVFTKEGNSNCLIKYPSISELKNCPREFVRLVYCLGYGEKTMINLKKNLGTPQFWKIFVACTSSDINFQFQKILKSKTRDDFERLQNKVDILNKLKEKGVWLLDASILAIYKNNWKKHNKKIKHEIINICWDMYIKDIIQKENPSKIIVIGKQVYKILKDKQELKKATLTFQPQARKSREEHNKQYEIYQKICNE